ncbi:MAG: transcriptional regulator [Sulfurimonas sp. RIFOXYB12_FULL_35_9]|nr:MAG: transcriptional regulator [Sulfurimonas sp. RIFOXYB12_FULL_35_9]
MQYLDCSKTQNIVKSTCQELGITQKELAEQLDVPQSTVSGWAKGDIPKMTKLALELMLENKSLKHKLQIFKEAHKIASEL